MKRSHISIFLVIAITITSLVVGMTAASAAKKSAGAAATVKVGSSSPGRILVDARGRTLYLFEKDTRGHSACSGACAHAWPPLLTKTKPIAGRGTKQSLLGVIRRANGTKQVTYRGHPLYRFVQDTKTGEAKGQGSGAFGAGWYVLSPTGNKIEQGEGDSGYPRQSAA